MNFLFKTIVFFGVFHQKIKKNFGYKGEEETTRVLLKDIFRTEIKIIKLDNNPITEKDIIDEKVGIMDIKAIIDNNTVCNIEMQVVKQEDIIKRILFYWSKMYSQEIKQGEAYEKSKKAVSILIADFEIRELEEIKKYITKWNLREEDYPKKILTDLMDIYIIELPKVEKYGNQEKYKNLNLWVKFLKNPEVFKMSEEERKDKNLKETIEAIEKSKVNLEKISEDEHEKELARLREKYIRDQNSILSTGYNEGKRDSKTEIAKKMLNKNMSIKEIIELTELTKEEIEKLK